MSIVISFRLNPDNPREAQALDILRTKQKEGFSSRRILTDALIKMAVENGNSNFPPINEFHETLEQVSGLLERLNGAIQTTNQPIHSEASALNDAFLTNVRIAARAGMGDL
jgi:hypothetical protein